MKLEIKEGYEETESITDAVFNIVCSIVTLETKVDATIANLDGIERKMYERYESLRKDYETLLARFDALEG